MSPSEYPSDSNSPNTLGKVSPDAFAPLDQNGEEFEADRGQFESADLRTGYRILSYQIEQQPLSAF
jgi:hypothetical protein